MAQFVNIYKCDLHKGPVVTSLYQVFLGDVEANRVGVHVTDNGEDVTLSGTCSGTAILCNGGTVALTGTVDGSLAYVDLPSAVYTVEGPVEIYVTLTQGDQTTTLLTAHGNAVRTDSGVVIDPGTIIPSVAALISDIDEAVASIPEDYSELSADVVQLKSDMEDVQPAVETLEDDVADLKGAVVSEANHNGSFDIFTGATSGKVYSRTGSKTNNNSFSISKLFKIDGDTLLLTGYSFAANNISTVAFYNENNAGSGNFVNYWIPESTGNGKFELITVPSGAKFFGVTFPNDHASGTQIYTFNRRDLNPVALSDIAYSKANGFDLAEYAKSKSFIYRENNGSYTFYTDNENVSNACYVTTKKPSFFYDVQVTGKLVLAGGTKSMHLLAIEQDVGASEPVAAGNPKMAVFVNYEKIRLIYRKNTTTETVAEISYTTGGTITARIQRKARHYAVTIIYDGKTYVYKVTEDNFGGTYHFGYAADFICFGLCTTSTGNYGTLNVNLDYLKTTGLGTVGDMVAPIAKASQFKSDDPAEKLRCDFAYKTLSRATFPPTATVNGYHTNPGLGYSGTGTWTWDSFFNAICAVHLGGEAVKVMKQDYIIHQNKKYSNGFFPRQVLANGQTDATTQPWNAQMALMLSETDGDYSWFNYDLLKADVLAWDTVRKTEDGLYWVHNGYETGLDNSSAIYYPEVEASISTMVDNCVSVMFSSLVAAEYMALAQIAKVCEPSAVSTYAEKYATIKTAINTHMWNSTDHFYYTQNKSTGDEIPVKHGENIAFAMWAKIPSAEQAEYIASIVESQFLADYGCYSVAKDDPTFHDDTDSIFRVNWNGPAWIPMMYCMAVGLHDYGYDTLAQQIIDGANAATEHFAKLEGKHTMPEFYNPDTLAGYGYWDYSWGICTAFYNEQMRNGSFLQSALFRE